MSVAAFSDYLVSEKNYSQHTVSAYIGDIEEAQLFLKENYDALIIDADYNLLRQWIVELVYNGIANRYINR